MTHLIVRFSRIAHRLALACAAVFPTLACADVVRDGTIGPDASVQPAGPNFEIPQSHGELRGSNLFHSFREFGLSQDQSATFNGTEGIDNIITRVTGPNASSIDGLLRSTIPGANLNLINPHGVVFGPNAQLDVQGAFHASTADTLQFENGQIFSADGQQPPILSMAKPEAFGFLGTGAAPIALNGSSLENIHDISLSGGTVALHDGASVATAPSGLQAGGDIALTAATSILLSGVNGDGDGAALIADGDFDDAGDAGAIRLEAPVISLEDDALVSARAFGGGASGDITLLATDSITLGQASPDGGSGRAGVEALLITDVQNADAGNIRLEAPRIAFKDAALSTTGATVTGTGEIPSEITASGGDITLRASDSITLSEHSVLQSFSVFADAGDVRLEAPVIAFEDASYILSSVWGSGASGDITPLATKHITFSGTEAISGPDGFSASGSSLFSQAFPHEDRDATAGAIRLEAPVISLREGALISTEAIDAGTGGDITLKAKDITLSGTNQNGFTSSLQATAEDGSGGAIRLETDNVALADGATINSSSTGRGNAGSVTVNIGDALDLAESKIITQADMASGGNIAIQSGGAVNLLDSEISTNVGSGPGRGGDIALTAGAVALNHSVMTAQADAGRGGNIRIAADAVLASADSVIDASAGPAGIGGEIEIAALTANLEGDLVRPATDFLNAAAILRRHCAPASAQEQKSSFTVARRPGLPLSPEDLLLAYDRVALTSPAITEVAAAAPAAAAAIAFRGGDFEKAQAHWRAAAAQYDRTGDTRRKGDALRAVVQTQQALGQYAASVDTLHTVLAEAQQSKDPARIASAMGSLGNAYVALGDLDTANQQLTRAVRVVKKTGKDQLSATLLNNLGNQLAAGEAWPAALAAYQESAELAHATGDTLHQAKATASAARAALALAQRSLAVDLLHRARTQVASLAATQDKVSVLIHLGKSYGRLAADSATHDKYGKLQAATVLREAATLSERLGDHRSLSYALGNLGTLYQREQRLQEALYLTRQAVQAAARTNAVESLYRWHWQEGQLLSAQGEALAGLAAYRRAVAILQDTRQETLARYAAAPEYFRQAVAPVYLELVDALLQQAGRTNDEQAKPLLFEARATVEQLKAAELRDYFRDACVTELEANPTRLEAVSPHAAVVYPVLLPQRLELLVSLPAGLRRYTVPVDANTLTQTVRQLRTAVESESLAPEYKGASQQLYDWLVRPYVNDLAGVDTLVFVPDGPLRTLPLAALHDGENYLIHRYSLGVTPGLALSDPRPMNRDRADVLLAGLSKAVQGFSPLPRVPQELDLIRQLYGGRMLLDETFTLPELRQALVSLPSVVHVASHAQFTGEAKSSFLLTYDGRLSLDDLKDYVGVTKRHEHPLELLVLSACQTAAGDDRAALGLAGVGIQAGARSALGSLWNISDEATTELISAFYRQLKNPEISKAHALQQAQQQMLAKPRFAHPFFWSAFVLINNWL